MPAINVLMCDRVAASGVRRTRDGYLAAVVPVARTGVQVYLGSELGMNDRATVRVYRPPEVVFGKDAMASYAHRPMTNDHPPGATQVTSDNWKALSVGITGGEVLRDGEMVNVPILLMDQAAINDYDAGKRELSMGYSSNIEMQDGVTPDGEQFDAVVTGMSMNHLALVDRARGGSALRIGDKRTPEPANSAQPTGGDMPNETKIVMVDGLQVVTTDAGAAAIEKLQGMVRDRDATIKMQDSTHAAALADKDKTLAAKDAEIDGLKAKVLTDAQIDAAAAARGDLLAKATAIHDADYTGKSTADIHKMVCAAKLGDAAIAGKSADYLAARFDILAEDSAPAQRHDPAANAIRQTQQVRQQDAADPSGQLAYEARLRDAYKGTTAAA